MHDYANHLNVLPPVSGRADLVIGAVFSADCRAGKSHFQLRSVPKAKSPGGEILGEKAAKAKLEWRSPYANPSGGAI